MDITVLGKDVFKNEISLVALSMSPFATAPVNSRPGNPFWTWTPWVKITAVLVGDSCPDSRTFVLSFSVLIYGGPLPQGPVYQLYCDLFRQLL